MKSLKEQLLIVLGLRVAGEDKKATIGGRQADIDHLDRGHLFDHRPSGQSRGQHTQTLLQRDVQTVGKESNEDVSFDTFVLLMMDGAEG
jgi:hypothetical protein